jgi:UDP-N-acetylmuramoylalanine--D-glutamate ligase
MFERCRRSGCWSCRASSSTGCTGFEPTAATVLNVTQDHLDWHGDMAAYAAAKARMFGEQALMVVNRDDPVVEAMVPQAPPAPGAAASPLKWSTVRGGRRAAS